MEQESPPLPFPLLEKWRMTMGLDGEGYLPWLLCDAPDEWRRYILLKRAILNKKPYSSKTDDIPQFLVLPGIEDAALESLHLIVDFLVRTYPSLYSKPSPSTIHLSPPLNSTYSIPVSLSLSNSPSQHPLYLASLLVQEDVLLLNNSGPNGEWRLVGGCVCFPTTWNLKEKMGKLMHEIHSPIPILNQQIRDNIYRFFSNLPPGSNEVVRHNWTVQVTPRLRLLPGHEDMESCSDSLTPDVVGDAVFFRVERQTIRKLTHHPNFILFTVRILQSPLREVVNDLEKCRTFYSHLSTMPEEYLIYKGLDGKGGKLILSYLHSHLQKNSKL